MNRICNGSFSLRFSFQKWYDSFIDILKSIFDFSLFLDPKFAYFSVSTLLLFTWLEDMRIKWNDFGG